MEDSMKKTISLTNKSVRSVVTFLGALAMAGLIVGSAHSSALAQSSQSTISGTVRDPNGAVIQGTTITLTDVATKTAAHATTNDEGFYLFTNVLAGTYSVTAER